ncbi:hypothetical protein ACTQZK_11670, partial [Paraeggerthella sp. LCP19S3_G8]|uniref:hypothetical protein n=1 Tax=Paraeggerthella sp. LCP19S3_G8 TaxID=3440248 RepID=UPI003F9644CC
IRSLGFFLACSASQYPVFKVLRFKPKPEAQGDILPVPPPGVKNFFRKVWIPSAGAASRLSAEPARATRFP